MKKLVLFVFLSSLLIFSMTACNNSEPAEPAQPAGPVEPTEPNGSNGSTEPPEVTYELTEEGIIEPEDAENIISQKADELIIAIRDQDAAAIADLVHPEKGVRFTPYTYVSVEDDVVLTKNQMANFFTDQTDYLWGYYDGTGDEILLTPSEYYEEFIYSEDFAEAPEIGYNEVLSSGNMLENQFEVYDLPIIVEYYFPEFEPSFEGMDWRSLRLVFEEHNGEWLLVGIIHNQWTI